MRRKSSKFRKIFIVTVMTVLLFSLAVHAQDMDLTEMDLDALISLEVDTVYTASKYEQKVTEAPSSITIITADEIKKYGYRELAEILASIRGFHTTHDRNYKYLAIRGFGLPSDYNNRILLLIDGIRHNETVYDSSALGQDFPVDVDNIKRVEVVRGPSSSLYGNSAFFGVVNVITKRGEDLQGLEISADAGSFETYQARLSYGNKLDNGLELLVSGTYLDKKGDDLYYPEFDDPDTNNGIAEGRDYGEAKRLFFKATYADFTLEGLYSDFKKGVPTAPWEGLFNGNLFTNDEYTSLDLKYDHTYDNELNVLARINYNKYKDTGEYPSEGDTDEGEAEIVPNYDSTLAEWVYGEFQVTKNLIESHRVTIGASYNHNLNQNMKTFYVGADWGFLDEKRNLDNWSIYAQDEFTISDGLILNLGVRYDDFESFGNTTNPRAALIYSPVEDTTIKAIYGRAFRAPSIYELYYNDGGPTQISSPDLDPETINTYELVYEQYIGNNLRGTIVGFYYKIDDLITQDESDLICDWGDPCLIFSNLDEVKAKGMEFELEGKWSNGYSGTVSYTVQGTENTSTGERLTNSPNNLAKAKIIVPILKEKFYLGIEEQFTGKRRTLAPDATNDFFVTNITLFSQDLIKGLDASFSVYNLFDDKHFDPGSGEHIQDQIEQDGATYRVRLTYRY
jgi:outer membrane receptor for ferrienterochelin and colicins